LRSTLPKGDFMRHVLLAVAGSTPQIVTETLWWLKNRADTGVDVQSVHVATTQAARVFVQGLCDSDGAITRLVREYGGTVPRLDVHVFEGPDGEPLQDIRNSAESAAFAKGITDLVRRLTMQPDTVLHASIAGGRKTMGFLLGQAMAMFARPQDRLSHVLVAPQHESCRDFWYPTRVSTILRGASGEEFDARDAQVELSSVPFVRLRGKLTAHDLRSAVADPSLLTRRIQDAVDAYLSECCVSLEVDSVTGINPESSGRTSAGSRARKTSENARFTVEAEGMRPPESALRQDNRPLAPVVSSLQDGCRQVLRLFASPDIAQGARLMLDCHGRASEVGTARALAHAMAANVRHALNLQRTGYNVVSCEDEPGVAHPEWVARIVPDALELRVPDAGRISSAGWDGGLRGLKVNTRPPSPVLLDLPVHAIATSEFPVELSWRIERVTLSEAETTIIDAFHRKLAAREITAAKEVRLDVSTVLPLAEAPALRHQLELWRQQRRGFRLGLVIRAAAAVPDALVAQIGAAAWGGREFHVEMGEADETSDPTLLDLSDCYCGDSHLPFEIPTVDELRVTGLRQAWLPAPREIPQEGMPIGRSGQRLIRLHNQDRARHVYAVGATGTGKSTLLRNMIVQDMQAGEGVFLLDPHGDLFTEVLSRVPKSREEDVLVLDVADTENPFGLNFLEVDPARVELSAGFATNELLSIFRQLYAGVPEALGPAFEQRFSMATMMLMNNDNWQVATLLDIGSFFDNDKFRRKIVSGCRSSSLLDMYNTAAQGSGDWTWANFAPYITNKINRFTLNPVMRNICCQPRTSVNFRAAMDEGRIVLVRIPKGYLSEMDVGLIGMLLIGKLFGAALGREALAAHKRRPTNVYIDEFQNFMTETAGQMMAEARKYGLRLILANQSLAQIDDRLRDIMLGNVGNMLTYRVGPMDANLLSSFYTPALHPYELQSLPNYHCAARMLNGGAPVLPQFVMQTLPPLAVKGKCSEARALMDASRRKVTRTRATVEAEFRMRMNVQSEASRR